MPPAALFTWQRCQFHIAQAIHHAPNAEIRKRIGKQLKSIWTEDLVAELVASYRDSRPSWPTGWNRIPDPAVFTLQHHRKRLRTSNTMSVPSSRN